MTEHSAVAVAPARLRLLGGWQLLVDGVEVELGHREQRLVALLALVDRSARAQVAGTLWPESTDERALASLRRAVLQCQRRCPGLLAPARLTISLAPGVWVDVDDLRRAAGLTELPMTGAVARELLGALLGDELLPGWYDDWVADERGRLEQRRAEALDRLAAHGLETGDLSLAVDAARGASEIDPLRESAREVAIRAHLGRRDVGSALHEFQRYSTLLREDLGVAPSGVIVGLVQPLLDEAAARRSPVAPPRQRGAPPEERTPLLDDDEDRWVPSTSLEDFLDGRRRGGGSGLRRAAGAVLGVAGVAVVVSLAVALGSPDAQQVATSDPGSSGVVERAPSRTGGGAEAAPSRTVRVRTKDTVDGAAVFAVRADLRPAQVRLVVRGPAGLRVVRHLLVRDASGRDVVVEGLAPGTYTWSATSATSSPVSGEVSVTPVAETRPHRAPEAGVTPEVTQVAGTGSSSPTPEPQQSSAPTSTPTPSATPSSHAPHPTPTTRPTGTPRDPGTVAPTPVG